MMTKNAILILLLLIGLSAIVVAWVFIGLSWYLNSDWFVFTENAFSDLGGPKSCCPWIYNYGLITTGILLILYSVGLTAVGYNRYEVIGGSYMLIAGIFLVLIGVFPTGTRPHTFVSAWFFIQSDLALTVLSYGLWRRTGSNNILVIFIMGLLAIPVAILVELLIGWPSAAVLETYGIVIIDVSVFMITLKCMEIIKGIGKSS
jgi:hypothetical membrane protein